MSWLTGGDALQAINTDPSATIAGPDSVNITSISPVLLASADEYYIRLYGIDNKPLDNSLDLAIYRFEITPCDTTTASIWSTYYTDNGATVANRIMFCDSATFAVGEFDGSLTVDKNADKLVETCIPLLVTGANPFFPCITDASTGAYTLVQATDTGGLSVAISYREPHVIALPDDEGYLMLLVRHLQDAAVTGAPSHDSSQTQIVAWWASTPDFTGSDVFGPLLLVDGMKCLHEDQTVRMWVGVPGGVLVSPTAENGLEETTLLVYYIIETTGLAWDPAAGHVGGPSCGAQLYDNVIEDDYNSALTSLQEAMGITFTPGIACKRIAWDGASGLKAIIQAHSRSSKTLTLTEDLTWDPEAVTVPGDLLGMIRCWISVGTYVKVKSVGGANTWKCPSVKSFFEVYDPDYVRSAAPDPVNCGTSLENYSLFLAMTVPSSLKDPSYDPTASTSGVSQGSGHGIWRGRALPVTAPLYNSVNSTLIVPVFGVDIVFAPLGDEWRSKDQVAESSATVIWIDPAALGLRFDLGSEIVEVPGPRDYDILPNGDKVYTGTRYRDPPTWWVLAGQMNPTWDDEGNKSGPLEYFEGTWLDGCQTWSALFTGSTYALPPPPARSARHPASVHGAASGRPYHAPGVGANGTAQVGSLRSR